METKRLFWGDSYLKECEGTVLQIKENTVILDKTIFYAFSGGQISDSGTINNLSVKDARITKNYDIEYELEEKPNFKVGDKVMVKINWEKRYELMKLHSAQHFVADFFEKESGITKTLGSNIREGKATLTYFSSESITELLVKIEKEINEFIKENHIIETWIDEKNEKLRHWKCVDFECGCGGTHVKNTSEIGEIRLKRKNGGKDKEVIEITLIT